MLHTVDAFHFLPPSSLPSTVYSPSTSGQTPSKVPSHALLLASNKITWFEHCYVVIEMRALSLLSSALVVVIELRATTCCCLAFLWAMAWWWYQKCFDWGRPVKCEKSTHTTPQEVGFGPGRVSAWWLPVLFAVGGSTARDQKSARKLKI